MDFRDFYKMPTLEFVPQWFNGYSFVIFEFFSAIVLMLIAAYSYKCYKFTDNIKNKRLATAFFLMGLGFISKISTNIIIHYTFVETINFGFFNFIVSTVKSSDILFTIGYFFYRLLILFGLYVFYLAISDSKENILFMTYFIIITTIFSSFAHYVFHMTVLILAGTITGLYYKNYLKRKTKRIMLIFTSFLLITIAQAFFIFSIGKHNIYVVSEIIQLTGFILLLYTFIKTIGKNAKKKQNRNNK